ncbi:MAG: KamA family radical SAM protein [Candidatus Omnitrophota bacterium]
MHTKTEEIPQETYELPDCGSDRNDWRQQLKNSIEGIEELNKAFRLDAHEKNGLEEILSKYPFAITPYYLSLIDKTDPQDPIKMQCVPSLQEGASYPEIEDDPLGEEKDSVCPGLVHRYPDRVLVTLTNMCPVYCRHCTRKREWRNGKWVRNHAELEDIYRYIRRHKEIRDVILSGGDPLVLSTERIDAVLKTLRDISHVEIIRIGTRCPVVLPQRVDDELVFTLKKYRPIWVNTHFNHPNEITKESARACDRILRAGIPINNQSVLLKNINDNTETMIELCQGLVKIGVRPYYLFLCDPVSGTGHFRTSIDSGLEIIRGMRGATSGLCIPTFVIDGLGGQGKIPLQPDYVVSKEKRYLFLKGYKGDVFKYYNPED